LAVGRDPDAPAALAAIVGAEGLIEAI